MLGRDAWGQGYAQEAMLAVMAFAGANGLRRLLRPHPPGQPPLRGPAAEAGLRGGGHAARPHPERDGERRDCRLFGLLL